MHEQHVCVYVCVCYIGMCVCYIQPPKEVKAGQTRQRDEMEKGLTQG